MTVTVDTSALLSVLLNEHHKSAIIRATKGHDLQAPASLDAEVGNALSAMFKRGRLTMKDAEQILTQFSQIPIRRTQLRLTEAVRLAHDYSIYAYDAYVLECAMQYRAPLLSLDRQLMTIAQKMNISIVEVSV